MNKAAIQKKAAENASAGRDSTPDWSKTAQERDRATPERDRATPERDRIAPERERTAQERAEKPGRVNDARTDGERLTAFQARIYASLVGATDFSHSIAGDAALCRLAFERSVVAVKVWQRERAKRA